MLYPLKFTPLFKEKIWGGQKIKTILGHDFSPLANCGELWTISGVKNDVSVVENGFLAENELDELIEVYMGDLVGESVFEQFGTEFPLLVKFIDAAADLSVQVHPNDELARERHQCNGKNELWHVLQADAGAGLYVGFKKNVGRQEYEKALLAGDLANLLEFYPVRTGDTFFIPAGTVHAIGKGVLLAEIQQTSDITYRIFDWNRTDGNGKSRELHTEQATEAINFTPEGTFKIDYNPLINRSLPLLRSKFFNVNLLEFDKPIEKIYAHIDSFVIYLCLEGHCHFIFDGNEETIEAGELLLVPANFTEIDLVPCHKTKLLEAYLDI